MPVEVGNSAKLLRRQQRFITARKNIVSQCDTANEVLSHRQFCRAYLETPLDVLAAVMALVDEGNPIGAEDEALRRLSYPRLRDQAVSIFGIFEQCKGEYCALWQVAEHQGMTPYLAEAIARKARTLVWIQGLGRRVRARLEEAPQPREVVRN